VFCKEKRLPRYSEGRGRVKLHQRWFREVDASCISVRREVISLALASNASAAAEEFVSALALCALPLRGFASFGEIDVSTSMYTAHAPAPTPASKLQQQGPNLKIQKARGVSESVAQVILIRDPEA
jgi:hypothetical protein